MGFEGLLVFSGFCVPDFDGLIGGLEVLAVSVFFFSLGRRGGGCTAACEPFSVWREFDGCDAELVACECVLYSVVWTACARGRFCSWAFFGFGGGKVH